MKPNNKYDHAYAIIRVGVEDPSVIKVMWSAKEAEVEVTRLNNVNKQKEYNYRLQVVRIERKRTPTLEESLEECRKWRMTDKEVEKLLE